MVENNIKILTHLEFEIKDLEDAIKNTKNANEILKLNIQKKELLLQKLELEQAIEI